MAPPPDEWLAQLCAELGLVEGSHHGRTDYRVGGKIVVNLDDDGAITLKLPLDEQRALLHEHAGATRLPPGWGQHGWTTVDARALERDLVRELVQLAIETVTAPKRRR